MAFTCGGQFPGERSGAGPACWLGPCGVPAPPLLPAGVQAALFAFLHLCVSASVMSGLSMDPGAPGSRSEQGKHCPPQLPSRASRLRVPRTQAAGEPPDSRSRGPAELRVTTLHVESLVWGLFSYSGIRNAEKPPCLS